MSAMAAFLISRFIGRTSCLSRPLFDPTYIWNSASALIDKGEEFHLEAAYLLLFERLQSNSDDTWPKKLEDKIFKVSIGETAVEKMIPKRMRLLFVNLICMKNKGMRKLPENKGPEYSGEVFNEPQKTCFNTSFADKLISGTDLILKDLSCKDQLTPLTGGPCKSREGSMPISCMSKKQLMSPTEDIQPFKVKGQSMTPTSNFHPCKNREGSMPPSEDLQPFKSKKQQMPLREDVPRSKSKDGSMPLTRDLHPCKIKEQSVPPSKDLHLCLIVFTLNENSTIGKPNLNALSAQVKKMESVGRFNCHLCDLEACVIVKFSDTFSLDWFNVNINKETAPQEKYLCIPGDKYRESRLVSIYINCRFVDCIELFAKSHVAILKQFEEGSPRLSTKGWKIIEKSAKCLFDSNSFKVACLIDIESLTFLKSLKSFKIGTHLATVGILDLPTLVIANENFSPCMLQSMPMTNPKELFSNKDSSSNMPQDSIHKSFESIIDSVPLRNARFNTKFKLKYNNQGYSNSVKYKYNGKFKMNHSNRGYNHANDGESSESPAKKGNNLDSDILSKEPVSNYSMSKSNCDEMKSNERFHKKESQKASDENCSKEIHHNEGSREEKIRLKANFKQNFKKSNWKCKKGSNYSNPSLVQNGEVNSSNGDKPSSVDQISNPPQTKDSKAEFKSLMEKRWELLTKAGKAKIIKEPTSKHPCPKFSDKDYLHYNDRLLLRGIFPKSSHLEDDAIFETLSSSNEGLVINEILAVCRFDQGESAQLSLIVDDNSLDFIKKNDFALSYGSEIVVLKPLTSWAQVMDFNG